MISRLNSIRELLRNQAREEEEERGKAVEDVGPRKKKDHCLKLIGNLDEETLIEYIVLLEQHKAALDTMMFKPSEDEG